MKAAGLAAAHPRGSQGAPGDGRGLLKGGRHCRQAVWGMGPPAAGKTGQRNLPQTAAEDLGLGSAPVVGGEPAEWRRARALKGVVGATGLEPVTSCV